MKALGFRQANSWLHTWSGLLLGWLLFAVFVTGTLSYFRQEITYWMQPELHGSQAHPQAAEQALQTLRREAPDAASWQVTLPDERNPTVRTRWYEQGERVARNGGKSLTLDATTMEPLAGRPTAGGEFLYRFHFELYGMDRTWGRWIVGVATMFMLVAIMSGVIIHKKIFIDFFTFRRRKGQRSWMDAHNALAVLSLPFHFMITYSGLLLLMFLLMPWGMDAAYNGDTRAFFSERGRAPVQAPAGADAQAVPAPQAMAPIGPMLEAANRAWPLGVASISVTQPGRAGGTVELRQKGAQTLLNHAASERMIFDAGTGELKEAILTDVPAAGVSTYNVFSALHRLRFADAWLRWLFFIAGVMGTAMVGTGMILWVVKRLPQKRKGQYHAGHRLVERLNVAALAGIFVAIGAYFWLNRLLPASLADRAGWEIKGFFLVWALTLVHAWLREHKQAWKEQLYAIVVLYAGLPIINFQFAESHLLATLGNGHWTLASVDLVLLATAALAAWAAWYLRPSANPVRKPKPVVQAAVQEATP
ncbi:PepSY domain-containing protein [Pusillimonas sp. CC-YST705]|uniref:PepSY domain-containing protein n=1 Tax=Mesopusillimonas faecipullorum TaxID=2755040 RepID=A0ABS8CBK7_9BURK|nr:PepSY-associated TM helix domain-containing protein [Mesopusillimonas faecipullorum]MCB5363410.1 PepSY domain-containing protein [Mesopusillimonas faecipullorum]